MRRLERFYARLPGMRPGSPAAYLVACTIVAAATALRLAVEPWVEGVQFVTFFPAVIAAAFVCGTGAGLLAVALSTFSAWLFVFAPRLSWGDAFPLALFVAAGAIVVLIIGGLRTAIAHVRQLNATLRIGEAKFRGLLESAPDAMVIVEATGRIVLVNARAETMFGYQRDELLGQPIEMLVPVPDAARHASYVAAFFARPQNRSMGDGGALYGRHKDGRRFPVEIGLSPLQTDQGVLASSAIRDISAHKRIEAQLLNAQRAAQAANRAKSDFLANMSHELRTPLNAVIGFGQLLEMDLERNLSRKQREYIGYILSGGSHLLQLVNEVLDLAGIEAGRMQLEIERVGVHDTLSYVHTMMAPVAETAGIEFRLAGAEGSAAVSADGQRLRQALINLVSNAIKYNRAGGTVTLAAAPAGDRHIRFAVTDTGIGIAPERQAQIFQPFQRLGAERTSVEGTGIGLAFSRRLVEAMAGSIGFTSAPGRGSTFWIELPAAGPAGSTAIAARSAAAES